MEQEPENISLDEEGLSEEGEHEIFEEEESKDHGIAASQVGARSITDKEFYKQMQKLKDRGSNAVPPKKSASAYIIFGKEKRAEILKRNPLAKVTEVVKEMAASWRALPKEDRQKYKEAAKKDKDRYEKELKSLEAFSNNLKKPKKCLSAYMIFVKETRPKIVEANPDMGALQVMQEVGKQWQSMSEEDRNYFKVKADQDKVRYLDDQRAYYDEVQKIGQQNGTVKTKDGHVLVAHTQHDPNLAKGKTKKQLAKLEAAAAENHIVPLLDKRKSENQAQQEEPNRRLKLEEKKDDPKSSVLLQAATTVVQQQHQIQQQTRKPISAYAFFSKQFRDIVRLRLPYVSPIALIKGVTYKWKSLSKEQKTPFENLAIEDKQRVEKESNDLKRRIISKISSPKFILPPTSDAVNTALELTTDLIAYIHQNQAKFESDPSSALDIEKLQEQEEYMIMQQEGGQNLSRQGSGSMNQKGKEGSLEDMMKSQPGFNPMQSNNEMGSIPDHLQQLHPHLLDATTQQQQQQQQFATQTSFDMGKQFHMPLNLQQQLGTTLGAGNPFQFDASRGGGGLMFQGMGDYNPRERKLSYMGGGGYQTGMMPQSPDLGYSSMMGGQHQPQAPVTLEETMNSLNQGGLSYYYGATQGSAGGYPMSQGAAQSQYQAMPPQMASLAMHAFQQGQQQPYGMQKLTPQGPYQQQQMQIAQSQGQAMMGGYLTQMQQQQQPSAADFGGMNGHPYMGGQPGAPQAQGNTPQYIYAQNPYHGYPPVYR
ncbi:hypothetical protein FGO68_gene4044 [Halteria grandinella]|uniref:HMG box domain-containing protein n=1 Tax=Halteria grandinella TaxID=5974 RepID=A0A8J8P0X7_HALGN|nr:hypothetical protein FGO68_gene4044 [Halteria grandinella]